MATKPRSYESDDVVVEYDVKRCIHAAECVKGLPSVFDPKKRPWIDPAAATSEDLARVIERCPTGALQYRRKDDGPDEAPPATNTIRIDADGPLYLSGDLRVTMPSGETIAQTRVALCRCGHSRNKPFCDNSHIEAGFQDPGRLDAVQLRDSGEGSDEAVEISLARNGPVLLRGRVELHPTEGDVCSGDRGALCRCGHSANKPFCDGSHTREGFVAD
jgi:CDGSH-type Zn-finger protein/uncharacterized Fe-S cluster protein YjdI